MEDSKLMKFRTLLDEVDKNLPGHYKGIGDPPRAAFDFEGFPHMDGRFGSTTARCYDLSIMDKYKSNPFVKAFCEYFAPLKPVESDLSIFIRSTDFRFYESSSHEARVARLVFWFLFVAAVDDEFYNNELSTIIDFAYCIGFNESMIRDWCHAVEYVLSGNRFSKNCDLEIETKAGRSFFIEFYGCQNHRY